MTRAPRTRSPAVALLLAALAACGGEPAPGADAPGAADDGPRSVLLICLDTVRADHLGFMGYDRRPTTPALDALAEGALVFDDVTAAACWTKPSVPSFMTGSFPATHGVYEGSSKAAEGMATDVLDERSTTLAEAFAEAGYATAGFLRNGQLAPGFGLDQGFELYDNGSHDASDIADLALDWLGTRDRDRPFFLYLHILDAHWPFDVPDDAALRFADAADLALVRDGDWHDLMDDVHDGERELTPDEAEGILDLYDSSLRYVDDHLARVFDALREEGLLDELVVSVVADHGEEFLEHGRYGHGHGLYENLTRVGWLLRAPGVPAGRHEAPVSLVDLHPSVLSAAGLEPDGELLAVDRVRRPDAPGVIFAEHKSPSHYEQSLRDGSWKLVREFRNTVPPLPTDALEPGTRWEAEFTRTPDGGLLATQLKPRDDPPLDPMELRGALAGDAEAGWSVAGVPLVLAEGFEVYGEAEDPSALAPGRIVKAKGDLVDGRLVAERIKLYADDEDDTPELRGPLTSWEGDDRGGTLRLGPLAIAVDGETRFKDVPDKPQVQRRHVEALLAAGAPGAEALGFTVRLELFDLAADPAEATPVETSEDPAAGSDRLRALSASLDRVAAAAAGRSVWAAEGAGLLDEALLEDLRALGYVR